MRNLYSSSSCPYSSLLSNPDFKRVIFMTSKLDEQRKNAKKKRKEMMKRTEQSLHRHNDAIEYLKYKYILAKTVQEEDLILDIILLHREQKLNLEKTLNFIKNHSNHNQ